MRRKRLFTKSEIEAVKKLIEQKSQITLDRHGKRVYSKSEIAEIKKLINDKSFQKNSRTEFSIYTIFEYAFEFLGWLKIMASPFLIGVIIALFIYLPEPNNTRLVIASIIATLSLIIGIILATRIWKKKGTMDYLGEIMASHDFDHFNDGQKKEEAPKYNN